MDVRSASEEYSILDSMVDLSECGLFILQGKMTKSLLKKSCLSLSFMNLIDRTETKCFIPV